MTLFEKLITLLSYIKQPTVSVAPEIKAPFLYHFTYCGFVPNFIFTVSPSHTIEEPLVSVTAFGGVGTQVNIAERLFKEPSTLVATQ